VTKEAILEALKEPLRILVLSILPLAISYFASLPYEWAAFAILVLRFLDKFLHEYEKELPVKEQNDGLLGLKGLTGF